MKNTICTWSIEGKSNIPPQKVVTKIPTLQNSKTPKQTNQIKVSFFKKKNPGQKTKV
jgi:hypothetical protein